MSKEPSVIDVVEALRRLQTALTRLYRHDKDIFKANELHSKVIKEVQTWDMTDEPFYGDEDE